jgi:hypothetical protein
MKPSDFYLSSRQLFGFLVPGLAWVLDAVVFLDRDACHSPLIYAALNPGAVPVLFLLAAGVVTGMLFQWISFWISEQIELRLRRERRGSRPQQRLAEMETRILRALQTRRDQMGPLWDLVMDTRDGNWARFVVCKNSVISRAPELSRRLLDLENEINLVGMLALPIVVLAVALWWHPFCFGTAVDKFVLPEFLGAFSVYLFWIFYQLRLVERKDCYEAFLLLEGKLAENASSESDKSEE